jgi:hypothetical protein
MKRKRSTSVFAALKKWRKKGGRWHGALPSAGRSSVGTGSLTSGKRGVNTAENKTRLKSPPK